MPRNFLSRSTPIKASYALVLCLLLLGGCGEFKILKYDRSNHFATSAIAPFRFAVIGDYGQAGEDENSVANLVKSWNVDMIITVGDNNYFSGEASTIDANIGQYYHDYISPYKGSFGAGASQNRFFPSLGNHDWLAPNAQPYLDYFTLPGNERYYDFVWKGIHFFALDSDSREPDGIDQNSRQAMWLKQRLAESTAQFKFVYFHHAPYSSSTSGSTRVMQWPFEEWGATAVLSGHDHDYERVQKDGGIPYFVNGLGGHSRYPVVSIVPDSKVRFSDDFGAMLFQVQSDKIIAQFITRSGRVIDTVEFAGSAGGSGETTLIAEGSSWKYLDNGTNQGTAWIGKSFNDSSWRTGDAQLGYGDGDENTVIGAGSQPDNKYITSYFRKTFDVPSVAEIRDLTLKLLRDDGAVVYLNGNEIHRSNMPEGAINYKTLAAAASDAPEESTFEIVQVDPGFLNEGFNEIAVEVHQWSPQSSDLSFDLALTASGSGVEIPPTTPTPTPGPGAPSSSKLIAGQTLPPDASLVSPNGSATFVEQGDGNLVLYVGGRPVWASGTMITGGGVLNMQGDGNLVIYDLRGRPVWASNTSNSPGSYLEVRDDGKVVIIDSSGRVVWSRPL